MLLRRVFFVVALAAAVGRFAPAATLPARAPDSLPNRLTDQEFWKFVEDFSEPNGHFRSDNLVSNELLFQAVIPELLRTTKPGRVYLGVGPEQNFTYLAALKPEMAFIIDVRQGNRDLHLLYKALFEISADRVEFVSRLFSRPRPPGLSAKSTAVEIFEAYSGVPGNWSLYGETLSSVRNQLLTRHGFKLTDDDVQGLEYILRALLMFGPQIQYAPFGLTGSTVQPTYAALMTATDGQGVGRSFLSSEQTYAFLKSLESRNAVVPLVGNFAGPKAIRAVGAYLRQKDATVSAFYVSNVEEYLHRDGIWRDFCRNLWALPLDGASTFIRSVRSVTGDPLDGLRSELQPMIALSSCR